MCIEFKEHSVTSATQDTEPIYKETMKLIEEILQYLNILIDYGPIESIDCLRQLQKFMFKRKLSNSIDGGEYMKFTEIYCNSIDKGLYGELFEFIKENFCHEFPTIDEKFAKNIKLFEPMVVYCLTVSMVLCVYMYLCCIEDVLCKEIL